MCNGTKGYIIGSMFITGLRVRLVSQEGQYYQVSVLVGAGMFCRGDVFQIHRKCFYRDSR